jgi:hypothetical protein
MRIKIADREPPERVPRAQYWRARSKKQIAQLTFTRALCDAARRVRPDLDSALSPSQSPP